MSAQSVGDGFFICNALVMVVTITQQCKLRIGWSQPQTAQRRQQKMTALAENRNLNLREAADRIGVSPHTLRRWALYGHRLPFLKMGRRLAFRPRDLEMFETSCLVSGEPRKLRNT